LPPSKAAPDLITHGPLWLTLAADARSLAEEETQELAVRFGILIILALVVPGMLVSGPVLAGDDTPGSQAGIGITATGETVEYELAVSSTAGGKVTVPGEGTFTYAAGTHVDLAATADEGFLFVNWTGDVETVDDVASAATTITMLDWYAITANFEEAREVEAQEFELAINSTAGGSVTVPAEGTFVYQEGSEVDLEATPEEGFEFLAWTGDADTIDDVEAAATTMVVEDHHAITATFQGVHPVARVNWGLIAGIIGAVVVVTVAVLLVRRRKAG